MREMCNPVLKSNWTMGDQLARMDLERKSFQIRILGTKELNGYFKGLNYIWNDLLSYLLVKKELCK